MDVTDNGAIDISLMEPVFDRYREQKGALIPILQRAQGVYGYLPPEVLQLISDRLGVSLSKVYGVATFYHMFSFEPLGEHSCIVCTGTVLVLRTKIFYGKCIGPKIVKRSLYGRADQIRIAPN